MRSILPLQTLDIRSVARADEENRVGGVGHYG